MCSVVSSRCSTKARSPGGEPPTQIVPYPRASTSATTSGVSPEGCRQIPTLPSSMLMSPNSPADRAFIPRPGVAVAQPPPPPPPLGQSLAVKMTVARLADGGSVTVYGGAVAGVLEPYLRVAPVSGGPVLRGGGRACGDPGRRGGRGHGVFHRAR